MLLLLGAALTASFLDCLNPTAIAQTLLLQAMAPKKRHTLFFILGIGLANLLLGLSVYFGLIAWATQALSRLAAAYPVPLRAAQAAAGAVLLLLGLRLLRRARCGTADAQAAAPASLAPLSLFLLGAAFCFLELSSALPYFGFLALLGSRAPALPVVLLFLLLYTFVYVLPLLLVYAGYNALRGTALLQRLERVLQRVSAYVVPGVLSAFAAFLLLHGLFSLL